MSDLRLAGHQVLDEQRAFWRNRSRAFFSFALPLMFLVIFASLNHSDRLDDRGGVPADTFIVPGLLAYGVVMATFTNIASDLSLARQTGALKRMQGSPLPTWAYMAGRVGSAVVVAVLISALTVGIAGSVYGVHLPSSTVVATLLALGSGTACFAALGCATVALIRNAESSGAITNALVLPLTFISGVWGEFGGMPSGLHRLAQLFPIEHLAHALQVAFDPRTTGSGLAAGDLLVLVLWTAVGAVLGQRALGTALRRD